MARLKNSILAGATMFAALGTGFVMQSSPAAEMRYGAKVERGEVSPVASGRPADFDDNPFTGVNSLELTSIAYTSAPVQRSLTPDVAFPIIVAGPNLATVGNSLRNEADSYMVPASAPMDSAAQQTSDCAALLVARPIAAAMVELSLTAPCEANSRVTLHHNGMMLTEKMDQNGKLSLQLPVLSQTAIFMASFDSGLSAMTRAEVTSLDIYDRVVVQWQGPGEIQIHALEFGADYGEDGHVWAEAPRSLEVAALGKGGFVTQLGRTMPDQDLRAQVYTFPSGTVSRGGDVILTAEAQITAQSCGRRLEGQALQITAGGTMSVKDLAVDMPHCDAIGDFLVLKNLLQDLKVARN